MTQSLVFICRKWALVNVEFALIQLLDKMATKICIIPRN